MSDESLISVVEKEKYLPERLEISAKICYKLCIENFFTPFPNEKQVLHGILPFSFSPFTFGCLCPDAVSAFQLLL
jgi:hypothetical protein